MASNESFHTESVRTARATRVTGKAVTRYNGAAHTEQLSAALRRGVDGTRR